MKNKCGPGWLLPGLLLALAGALCGQQTPTFHSHADLVQIPVTVLNRGGHFVDGLGKDDFKVTVDGKPVALISVDRLQPPAPPTSPTHPATPNVYSNAGAVQPAQRLILLLDYEHTPITYLPYLRSQMKKWFAHSLPPGEQVAIFALDGGLEVLQPFTSDRDTLVATIDRIVAFHSSGDRYAGVERELELLNGFGGAVNDPLIAAAADGATDATAPAAPDASSGLQELQEILQRGQYSDTMHALEEMAEILEGVPGRKSVIWLTTRTSLNSLMNPRLALSGDLRDQAFGHLNQADVALFPLDVSGLETLMPPINARFTGRNPWRGQQRVMMAKGAEHQAMSWAATSTGGEAFFNTNGFGNVVTKVIQASAEAYLVSFTPPPARKGHEYRTVKVQIARAMDLRLLYRRQYLQPEITLADQSDQDFTGQVRRLALTPLEMGSFPIAVRTGPLQAAAIPSRTPGKPEIAVERMNFALVVPYKPLLHADIDSHHASGFDFSCVRILIPLDDPARVMLFPPGRFQKRLTDEQAQQLATRAVIYRAHLEAPAGHLYLARLVVRDNLTGQMGSVSFRVDARTKRKDK